MSLSLLSVDTERIPERGQKQGKKNMEKRKKQGKVVRASGIPVVRLAGLVQCPQPEWGGGGDSCIKMPGCVCRGSENVPILKDALGKKKHTHIKGFLCIIHGAILSSNVSFRKVIHNPSSFDYFCIIYVGCSSLYTILNINSYPY